MWNEVAEKLSDAHVVANFKFLHLSAFLLEQFFDQKCANSIASVPLLSVGLNDNSTIDTRSVIIFVLARVVRVHGVTHVRRNKK